MSVIRCRFCDWSRPAWWTNRAGKVRSAWDSLREHMGDEHPSELAAIEKRVRVEVKERHRLDSRGNR